MLNTPNVSFTHATTACHCASVPENAESWRVEPASDDVSTRASVLPGRTVQPPAQRLRNSVLYGARPSGVVGAGSGETSGTITSRGVSANAGAAMQQTARTIPIRLIGFIGITACACGA